MNRFLEVQLNNWDEIHVFAKALYTFAFRGQANSDWDLVTSIERCFEKYSPVISMYENKEHWTLHEFKAKFHLYSNHPPQEENNFEWLALLQHHGCPTRLLDFTESLYIAAYFAVSESASTASIWSVNTYSLNKRLYRELSLRYDPRNALKDEINRHHVELINKYIANQNSTEVPSFVVPLLSTKRSLRLSSQQGLFIAPINMGRLDGGRHFMRNLAASFGANDSIELQRVSVGELSESAKEITRNVDILKINIPNDLHRDTIRSLTQMNITEEALFPGLDGLARSLVHRVIRY